MEKRDTAKLEQTVLCPGVAQTQHNKLWCDRTCSYLFAFDYNVCAREKLAGQTIASQSTCYTQTFPSVDSLTENTLYRFSCYRCSVAHTLSASSKALRSVLTTRRIIRALDRRNNIVLLPRGHDPKYAITRSRAERKIFHGTILKKFYPYTRERARSAGGVHPRLLFFPPQKDNRAATTEREKSARTSNSTSRALAAWKKQFSRGSFSWVSFSLPPFLFSLYLRSKFRGVLLTRLYLIFRNKVSLRVGYS